MAVLDGRLVPLSVGDVVFSTERGDRLVVVGVDGSPDDVHEGGRVMLAAIGEPFEAYAYDLDGDVAVHGYWSTGSSVS